MKLTKKLISAVIATMLVLSMCIVSFSASESAETKTIFLKPSSNWKISSARFAAYIWDNNNATMWLSMTDDDNDGYYKAEVPTAYSNIIFCRMNPTTSDNNWNNKWNQTSDLTVPTNEDNCYTINEGTWDKGGGVWSEYTPASTDTTAPTTQQSTEETTTTTETTSVTTEPTTAEPTTEPISQEAKFTAFSGNTIWADTAQNPKEISSTLALVKIYNNHFYLPETANLSSLPIYYSGYSSVKIGDYQIKSGDTYDFSGSETYSLYLNGTYNGTLKFYKSTSPALYLNTGTNLPTTTYQYQNKDDFETSGTIGTSEEGKSYQEGSLKKIKGRGNSSWQASYSQFGKYSFNITLDSKTKLFSTMNKGKKFCLLANNADESYLRNVYTFLLSKQIGLDFTPTFQYVDLYNNGNYIGSYLVTDKIEVNSQSVNLGYSLDDLNENANPNTDIATANRNSTNGNLYDSTTSGYKKWFDINSPTVDKDSNAIDVSNGDGSYLLEFELGSRFGDEVSGFISNKGQHVVVKSPEFVSKSEVDYISSLFNKAESAVYNTSTSLEELNKVIDVESFIKVFFIQELPENLDSCATSYYVYYDSKVDNRLHAAPVWDYDWAYGQYSTQRQVNSDTYISPINTNQWYAKIKNIFYDNGTDLGTCTSTRNFQAKLTEGEAWNTALNLWNGSNGFYNTAKTIINGNSENTIGYYINDVQGSAKMNESRWNFISNNPLVSWGSADTGSTYSQTTSYLVNWVNSRIDWMNNGSSNSTPLYRKVVETTAPITEPSTVEPTTAIITTEPTESQTTEPTTVEPTTEPTEETTAMPTTEPTEETTQQVTTEEITTTQETTLPQTEKLNVSVSSNFFDSAEQSVDLANKTVTVTFRLGCNYKLINGQWTMYYDNTKLKFSDKNINSKGTYNVTPNIIDGIIINPNLDSMIKCNFSRLSLYDFTTEKDFISVTFDILDFGDTTINLDIENLSIDNGNEVDCPLVKNSIVQSTQGTVFENLSVSKNTLFTEPQQKLYGDVNDDGIVNISDSTQIVKYLMNITKFDDRTKDIADVNNDGVVDINDVTLIQKFSAQVIDKLL